jgi:HNH endonuclease
MKELDPEIAKAAAFYDQHYAGVIKPLFLRPNLKMVLGDGQNPVCRFCGRSEPSVTFKLEAHAIPEALGNKSLTTNYECDGCNQTFGRGIENDLGNWSKPSRTFARIRGKRGVPALRKGGPEPGWRIEYGSTGFNMEQYEHDPIFVVDEEKKQIRFDLKRDAYTPVAVLKAFVKIGLTLLPAEELPNFREALAWIREPDHTKGLVKEFPALRTFRPGPMPNDLMVVMLMRRKVSVTGVPYAFLVLAYGNEVFQVFLPSPKQDAAISGQKLTFPAFPTPGGPDPARYGRAHLTLLDLTGREVIRSETVPIVLGFDQAVLTDLATSAGNKPTQT